jgi:hypothetical protein
MSNFLVNVLTSDPAITVYSIVAIIVLGYIVRKYPWAKKYTDIAVDIFAHIEENYKSWGIKGNDKLEHFIKEFVARYYAEHNKIPTDEIIKKAIELVESLVIAQNAIAENE